MPSEAGRAEVVGGGIGGLTAAAALARRGWQVRLHERDSQIRALGSGIYLWSNGLAVLDYLGVLDDAVGGAHYGGAFETRDHHNAVVSRIPVNGDSPVRVVTIVRERLINALVAAARSAGVEIVTDS